MGRMASIYRNGTRWRVQLYVQGVRDSETFRTRQEAAQWALQREAEISGRKLPDKSLKDAMRLYAGQEAPKHRGGRWEIVRLAAMERDGLARRKLSGLSDSDMADWRDARLKQVKPGTVAREMNLMRSVLEFVRLPPYRWIRANPMIDVKWPQTPPGRKRRVSAAEVEAIVAAFNVEPLRVDTATQRVGLAFLFALETAMRSGEICGLAPADVFLQSRYVVLPKTKNGDSREVPLSTRAVEILELLLARCEDGRVFGLGAADRDALWRKARPADLKSLHFHDTRGEAIWRLSKKLDVLQLARVIGHRNPASLMIYYRESAADMAKRLD